MSLPNAAMSTPPDSSRAQEGSPLIGESVYAPSWPVVQPPKPSFSSLGCCQTCCAFPSAYGCGGCRICCYSILSFIPFMLLLGLYPILAAIFLTVLLIAGLPLSYFIIYLFFLNPPPELVWKVAKLVQLTRLAFYQIPKPSEWKVEQLAPKGPLETGLLQYAIAVRVPFLRQDELYGGGLFEFFMRFAPQLTFISSSVFVRLPQMSVKKMTPFKEGENPVQYVMDVVKDIYPPIIQEWIDKTSDRALTHLCLHGLGAHRMEMADNRQHPGCRYVVRTNQMSTLTVREGYETYGNDAYFDENFRVVKIVRAENGEVWEGQKISTYTPDGSRDWEYAKFCFRCSLFTMVTLVDHLYGTHLQLANVAVQAMREQLSADHPIRRFLVPFSYGSININDLARQTLVTRDSWLPRSVALDDEGLQLAWAAAPQLLPADYLTSETDPIKILESLFDREAQIEEKRRQGLITAYYNQALRYWKILRGFVSAYVDHYYGQGEKGALAMAGDQELRYFMLQSINMFQALKSPMSGGSVYELWPKVEDGRKRKIMIDFICRICELATAGHEHVGGVQAYAQDPSFCSFSWPKSLRKEGALVAQREIGVSVALVMALTSTPMPKLMVREPTDDWSHIFPATTEADRSKLNKIFQDFQSELLTFSKWCDEYNREAKSRAFPNDFGIWVFNPKYLETSVSI